MRIPNLNIGKYQKSLYKTQKVKRTISSNRPYIQKNYKQKAEKEQELLAYLRKQKELDKEITEKLNNSVENFRASEIQYNLLILYGIKLDKEVILQKLKARKAE